MTLTLSLLKSTLARLHCACDAMQVKAEDVRLGDFPLEERQRWLAMADEDIRQFINSDITTPPLRK